MGWRYYAQRPVSGLWLDNNVQLKDVELDWVLSGPNSGSATIPNGLNPFDKAPDGKAVWGRYNTLLYAEEDGELQWVGVCTSANPDKTGLHLEFVGFSGLLQHIPYTDIYRRWSIDVFDVVRHLLAHARAKADTLDIIASGNNSGYHVGDKEPPPKPTKPHRKKGETPKEFKASKRYKAWEKKQKAWDKKYKSRQRYELLKWEAPYVGEEIDQLAKDVGFEYREETRWVTVNGVRRGELKLLLNTAIGIRRSDIQFVDGVNLAQAINPKDGGDTFANRVIGLGAGEGQKMRRVSVGGSDGRLYQTVYVQYKNMKNLDQLRARAAAALKVYKTTTPEIDTVTIWDTPGMADVRSLNVGDEVEVISELLSPPVRAWGRITKITRKPESNFVNVDMERAG